jgi:hypothetical protein
MSLGALVIPILLAADLGAAFPRRFPRPRRQRAAPRCLARVAVLAALVRERTGEGARGYSVENLRLWPCRRSRGTAAMTSWIARRAPPRHASIGEPQVPILATGSEQ